MNEDIQTDSKISIDQFSDVEMIVGKILEAEKVPDTDKLLRLTVDMGEKEPRQIVSGISEFFPEHETLVGKLCVFVANLAPRTIRGLESNGMILAAHTEDGEFALMVPEKELAPGTRIG